MTSGATHVAARPLTAIDLLAWLNQARAGLARQSG